LNTETHKFDRDQPASNRKGFSTYEYSMHAY